MGNTIHQLGVQLVADTAAVLLRACCGCLRIAALVNRCVSGHRKLDQLICFADTVGYLALNDFLSVENDPSEPVRRLQRMMQSASAISCAVSTFFRSAGASCLDFYEASFCFRCFLDSLGCHVSVGNTGRAGSNGENLHLIFFCFHRLCKTLIYALFLFIGAVDNGKELFRCPCVSKALGELFIHQHHGKFT